MDFDKRFTMARISSSHWWLSSSGCQTGGRFYVVASGATFDSKDREFLKQLRHNRDCERMETPTDSTPITATSPAASTRGTLGRARRGGPPAHRRLPRSLLRRGGAGEIDFRDVDIAQGKRDVCALERLINTIRPC